MHAPNNNAKCKGTNKKKAKMLPRMKRKLNALTKILLNKIKT